MLSPKLNLLIINDNMTKLSDLLLSNNSENSYIYYTDEEFKNLDTNELLNLCSKLYTTDDIDYRVYILNNLHKFNKDLCHEHFHKIIVQYLYNPLIEINEQTLVKIIKESIIPIDLKYECAKLIYNEYKERNKDSKKDDIHLGYKILTYILDKNINKDVKDLHRLLRLEIIQNLVETYEYETKVQLFILQYLSDEEIFDFDKYKDMLNLVENPKTKLNYVYYIFKTICLSNILSSRYVILGAQFVFINSLFSIEDKLLVEREIIGICQDVMLDYNIRADACDFLLTIQGVTEEGRQIGRNIIIELGRNNIINNIYYDKQNVHNEHIDKSVKNIIEIIMNFNLEKSEKKDKELTYDDMCSEVIKLFCLQNDIELTEKNININNIESKKETIPQLTTEDDYIITQENFETLPKQINNLNAIKSSLGRFQLDRIMYSDVPKTQILFVKVWKIVNQHEHKNELIKRLFEELIDMNGTCSTGHLSRLINIFSGFELNGQLIKLNIDCKSEMTAVTMAKINKRIQDLSSSDNLDDEGSPRGCPPGGPSHSRSSRILDEKYQNDLIDEMMWTNNLEKRKNLNKFIRENIMSIRDELYKEYVIDQKLINDEIFEINFRSILHKLEY